MHDPNKIFCYAVLDKNGEPTFHKERHTISEKETDVIELYAAPPNTAVRIPALLNPRDQPSWHEEFYKGWNACRQRLITTLQEDAKARLDPTASNVRDRIDLKFSEFEGQIAIYANNRQIGWIRHNRQAALPYGLDMIGFNFVRDGERWRCTRHDGRGRVFYDTLDNAKTAALQALNDMLQEQMRELVVNREA